jgi:hypothetical protein
VPAGGSGKLSSSGSSFTGIRYDSLAQAPRSMSLQRDEQNGRKRLSADQTTGLPQVGQRTIFSWLMRGIAGCVTRPERYFNPPPDSLYSPGTIIENKAIVTHTTRDPLQTTPCRVPLTNCGANAR